MIAIFRNLGLPAQQLQVTGFQGKTEVFNLLSSVVNVELPGNGVASKVEDSGNTVPQGRPPGVAHMQKARRVGADKFHLDLAALPQSGPAVIFLLFNDPGNDLIDPVPLQVKINKAGPGYFYFFHPGQAPGKVLHKNPGYFPGRHPCRLGQEQGQVGGQIPVPFLPRRLNRKIRYPVHFYD
ncbi:MAG: hypothetical protein BWY80_00796 [Firmicutes bacterium ADurb.Bin456]|nr:MAG: hypothetical protein BWY80_00796 [Firmicutes bacterium ADurb.Bin456]